MTRAKSLREVKPLYVYMLVGADGLPTGSFFWSRPAAREFLSTRKLADSYRIRRAKVYVYNK